MHRAVFIFVLLAALPCFAGKKPLPTLVKLDPQSVELAALHIPAPKQPCPNWAWAATVQRMLELQGVIDFKQDDLVLKAYAGEVCIETTPDFAALKQKIDGDYTLLDSRKVHIEAVVTPGSPRDVGHLIERLRKGRVLLMLVAGKPLVLQALEYDEYIYPNDQRMFEARKLTFFDPLSGKPVVFEKLKDDAGTIDGIFEVRVGPIEHFR